MSALVLIEAVGAMDTIGTTQTVRLSNRGYRTEPSDTPPNAPYDDRLSIGGAGSINRQLYSAGRTSGSSQVGYGVITADNTDGALDALRTLGFAGRPCTIKLGEPGQSFGTLTTAIKATMAQVELTRDSLRISLKDRLYELDRQHLKATYAGTNALPAGLEGVDDLKGQLKPLLIGSAQQFVPPCVNTARLIYQISDSQIQSVDRVEQGGLALTAGTSITLAKLNAAAAPVNFTVNTATDVATTSSAHGYATGDPVTVVTSGALPAPLVIDTVYYARVLTTTTLTLHASAAGAAANTGRIDITTAGTGTHNISNNRTAAGAYDWCFDAAGSYIRLGLPPGSFVIAVDATAGASAADRTVAQLLKAAALRQGIDAGDIEATDVTALDALNSAVAGDWINDERTTLTLMDAIANSIGAFFAFDRLGKLRMGQLQAPSVSPPPGALEISPINGSGLDILYNADGQPTYRVTLRYARYSNPQTSGLAGSISDARKAQLAQPYRSVTVEDLAVLTQHKSAVELTIETLLAVEADATAEAARQLALRKVARPPYRVQVALDVDALLSLELNAEVVLRWPRFGLDAGATGRVIAADTDYAAGTATLTVMP